MAQGRRRSRKQNRIQIEKSSAEQAKTHAAIYARLSKADVDTGKDSMSSQLALLRLHAEKMEDIEIVREFSDDGFTGLNFDRPAFEEMMEGVHDGRYGCIIVKDLSRLGRSYLETSDMLELELPMFGCRFISVNDNIDTKYSQLDTILLGLKNIMNQKYAEDLSRKIRASFEPRIKKGEYLGGAVTYGYMRDPKNKGSLLINDETAPVVRRIFQMKLDRMNDKEIAEKLTEEHLLSPSEYTRWKRTGVMPEPYVGWKQSVIRIMTQNPVYLGHVVHGKFYEKQHIGEKPHKKKKKDWIIYENVNPPIITQEVFDRVQVIRSKLRGKRRSR